MQVQPHRRHLLECAWVAGERFKMIQTIHCQGSYLIATLCSLLTSLTWWVLGCFRMFSVWAIKYGYIMVYHGISKVAYPHHQLTWFLARWESPARFVLIHSCRRWDQTQLEQVQSSASGSRPPLEPLLRHSKAARTTSARLEPYQVKHLVTWISRKNIYSQNLR